MPNNIGTVCVMLERKHIFLSVRYQSIEVIKLVWGV